MVWLLMYRAVQVAVAVAAALWLTARLGRRPAVGAWAVAAAVACGAGAWLLGTSAVGRVTWRNRAAGWLLPWAGLFAGRRLWPMAVGSWVGWALVGGAAVALAGPAAAVDDGLGGAGWAGVLVAGWLVNLEAAARLLRRQWEGRGPGASGGLAVVVVAAGAGAVVAASVGLVAAGRPWAAVLAAWGPAILLAAGFGLFAAVVLTAGRNARWN